MDRSKTTALVICAYNEENCVRDVVEQAKQYGIVFIVDDGSSDATAEIARDAGAIVVQPPVNLGQGLAAITGFNVALSYPVEVIIELDADGQHDPAEIPKFLDRMEETGADIVVGSRVTGENYDGAPWVRRYFLPKLTAIVNWLTGYSMTDSMCGYRAFRAESLRRALPVLLGIREPQYLAAERFIRFSRLGLTVDEIPIHMRGRASGISRKGLFRYGWGVARGILLTLVEKRN